MDGQWFYMEGDGAVLQNRWLAQGGTWYYLTGSGAMATGWAKVGGTWYFFDASGAMLANTWVDGYYLTSSGAMVPKAASGSQGSGSHGAVQPIGSSCPANAPIKGNQSSSGQWIYYRPGQQAYARTQPEQCFATTAAAQAAGYRPARR